MIAFVSAGYFGDLRCAYELASFCKLHQQEQQSKDEHERQALGERLLLVSLDWPGILSPLKRAELTGNEELPEVTNAMQYMINFLMQAGARDGRFRPVFWGGHAQSRFRTSEI